MKYPRRSLVYLEIFEGRVIELPGNFSSSLGLLSYFGKLAATTDSIRNNVAGLRWLKTMNSSLWGSPLCFSLFFAIIFLCRKSSLSWGKRKKWVDFKWVRQVTNNVILSWLQGEKSLNTTLSPCLLFWLFWSHTSNFHSF